MISWDGICCVAGAFLLLILPAGWILSALTAAAAHELCHILAVGLLGGTIRKIRIRITGCEIQTDPMAPLRSVLCILAGPAGSFLLLLLRQRCPLIAVCGFLQGCYNLLPVLPLDGGRILLCLLETVIPDRREDLMNGVRFLVCGTMILAGILAAVLGKVRLIPVIGCLLFNIGILRRKIPCNAHGMGLQWY
jgi:Zn-dependent protease